jgi:CheY-like chemotaxis protein
MYIDKEFDVLIVEDDPTARRALRALVASCGYRTDAVASAEDALSHIAGGKMPMVALVDLDLPGMSGLELIRRLKTISSSIFPVLITAAAREVVEEAPHALPVVYFQKPVDFDRLMSTLNDYEPSSEQQNLSRATAPIASLGGLSKNPDGTRTPRSTAPPTSPR